MGILADEVAISCVLRGLANIAIVSKACVPVSFDVAELQIFSLVTGVS
jgi:hypothetical protein